MSCLCHLSLVFTRPTIVMQHDRRNSNCVEIEIIKGVDENGEVVLVTGFQDLVEVFDLRDPSSMLLGRLFVGVVTAWSLRVTKKDDSDAKSFVVLNLWTSGPLDNRLQAS